MSEPGADPDITIRHLTPDEWVLHRDVRLRALSSDPQFFGTTAAQARTLPEQTWRARCNDEAWFAVRGSEAVGIVRLLHATDQEAPELISMWVAPEVRRCGIGERLMRAAMSAAARESGVVRLWVVTSNEPAGRLYRRLGFTATGKTAINEAGDEEMEMAASLRA